MADEQKPEPVGSRMPAELRDIVQKMIDDDADDDTIRTVVDRYMDDHDAVIDQTINELKGLVKGTVKGAASTIKAVLWDMPTGVIADTYNIAKGLPPENAAKLLEGIVSMKDLPEQFKNATHEERGQMMGELLGGFMAAKYAPAAPRTIARGAGSTLEFTGKKAEWPIRMVGAHALGEGNLLGGAMIAAPEAIQGAGTALREWGEGGVKKFPAGTVRLVNPVTDEVVATNPSTISTKSGPKGKGPSLKPNEQGAFRSAVASNVKKSIDELPNEAKKGLGEVDKAISSAKKESRGIRIAARKAEDQAFKTETRADLAAMKAGQKESENAARLAKIEENKTGLVPKKPSISESISAEGPEGRVSMRTAYGPPEDVVDPSMKGLTPFEQELMKRATSVRSAPSNPVDRLAPKTEPIRIPVPKEGLDFPTAEKPLTVAPTRTSGARNATIPTLSENDVDTMVEILQKNPGISKEEALNELVKQRGQRQSMYREQAGLSKLEQSALDRDLE